MDTVDALLDNCKETRSLRTDAELAALLGVKPSAVSNWRSGRAHPDEVSCARISAITAQPLGRILGIVGEARAVSAEAKKVWRRLAETAVVAFAALGLTSAPGPAAASHAGVIHSATTYTLCAIRRWLEVMLRRNSARALRTSSTNTVRFWLAA